MRLSHRFLTFLNWFSLGLITPVLSLMLLERGCTLKSLPLVIACYSAVVILCEVPSGVYADMAGRRRTFLVSCGLCAAATVSQLFAYSVWSLVPGFMLSGAARAFSSGSLDALFVEETVREKGPEALATAAGQLSLWQTLGLTAGAMIGGMLPAWRSYTLHLTARLVLTALIALLCALLVREEGGEKNERRTTLRTYLAQSMGTVRASRPLSGLLLGLFASGAILGIIETYWQPTFTAMALSAERPLLGVVSAAGFLACTLGNLAVRRVSRLAGRREWGVYLFLRVALTALVGFLALQTGAMGFLAVYVGVYLVVGGSDVMEQTLLNRMVPDGQRAGFLSVASLCAQVGGMAAGCAASLTVEHLGISGLLLGGGAVVLACALGAAALIRQKTREAV